MARENPIAAEGYPYAPPGLYVMDAMADTCHAAYVGGPFASRREAVADLREYNIAGDLEIMRYSPLKGWREA